MKGFAFKALCLFAAAFYVSKSFADRKTKILEGRLWKAKKIRNKYILSIKNKAEIVTALMDFIARESVTAGSVCGVGAVNEAVLRFFDPEEKSYSDKTFSRQMEIANLTGNISTKDGNPYLHLHAVLGSGEYAAFAGHLLSAQLNGAGEFIVESFPGKRVERTFCEEIGLNIYDFDK